MSVWLRRKITFTFPSETDGNKWPQNAIFRLSQTENNIYVKMTSLVYSKADRMFLFIYFQEITHG